MFSIMLYANKNYIFQSNTLRFLQYRVKKKLYEKPIIFFMKFRIDLSELYISRNRNNCVEDS